jgi:hypothetical protein
MEIMRMKSRNELAEMMMTIKYSGGNWIPSSDRIDTIVGNYIEHEPVEHRDYIIRLRSKYDCEEKYHFHNELFFYSERDKYCWMNDWFEGQQDVDVIAIQPIDALPPEIFNDCIAVRTGTLEEQLNLILEAVMTWCEKQRDGYASDVIASISYTKDGKGYTTNQIIEFNGNEYKFEWSKNWWEMFGNVTGAMLHGIVDPDDIEVDKYYRFMEDDGISYRNALRFVDTGDIDTKENHVYRRLDKVLKKFAHENDCMEEDLVVLWVHKENDEYVLRQDTFVYIPSVLSDAPEKMYQVPCVPMACYTDIQIWAIEPMKSIHAFDHWFVSLNSVLKENT